MTTPNIDCGRVTTTAGTYASLAIVTLGDSRRVVRVCIVDAAGLSRHIHLAPAKLNELVGLLNGARQKAWGDADDPEPLPAPAPAPTPHTATDPWERRPGVPMGGKRCAP